MLTTLVDAFTQGDIAGLKAKLLHSTCWNQHNHKAYGEDKLQAVVLDWLKLAGQCEVISSVEIKDGQQQVINLSLKTANSEQPISYTLWLETNGEVIKRVDAIVDTAQLAIATAQSPKAIAKAIPTPDAFVLLDYDQQDHLQDELATPSMLADMPSAIAQAADTWWSIWSNAQLSAVNAIYNDDTDVQLAGSTGSQSNSAVFESVLGLNTKLTRVFAQIQQVAVAGEQVAVKWYLDGDEKGNRIRIPFISLLTIKDGKIAQDITTCDAIAHKKRFTKSDIFSE
ncbi:nuclear transport factor 2 family protein [Psychrobium sp. MM17-31]|uniref:nuclear transport factor 2 family protein n=1 Tax=Psychrobium sp. MM17-31 TaxID=2917758 RepID=UPI001EF3FE14|nr:nuclear transport factor 2 family protein [Psychrobium sp. MM17-31]MCG7533184.1 nuclear transport factor 2 family protein [Psychrobium sp. MM17-31]